MDSMAFISTRARANSKPRGPTRGMSQLTSGLIQAGMRRSGRPPAARSVLAMKPRTGPSRLPRLIGALVTNCA